MAVLWLFICGGPHAMACGRVSLPIQPLEVPCPLISHRTDFENAERGLIARLEPGVITGTDGRVVYDADVFAAAMDGECPDTVNPSLWRQSQLTAIHGLYEVTDGHLPGPRPRPVEHDAGRGRHRRHRHRPADLRGVSRPPRSRCTASTAATARSPR